MIIYYLIEYPLFLIYQNCPSIFGVGGGVGFQTNKFVLVLHHNQKDTGKSIVLIVYSWSIAAFNHFSSQFKWPPILYYCFR